MKKAKIRSRKAFSVFLAMLMILTSVSVCFTSFAAGGADYDAAIAELAEALKSDTVKNFASYTAGTHTNPVYTSTGSGKNMQKTYTTTFNAKDYAQYTEVINILQKIDDVIKSSVTYQATNPFSDGDTKSCLEFGDLSALIQKDLLQSGKITTAEMSEYQVATLFNILFRANDSVSHNSKTNSDSSVCARIYNVLNVKTTDYKGYLAELNSRSEVAAKIEMASLYKTGVSREQYKVGSGCSAKTWYHHAITAAHPEDIALTTGTETNTEVKQKIDEYVSYLGSVDFDMTYDEMLDMVLNNTMNAFYNEFKAKNDAIVEYVGGLTTFNKLFSDYAEKIDQMFKSCESAMDVETYLKIAEQWKAFTDANPNYGVYNYGAYEYEPMVAAYEDFMQIYAQLQAGGDELLSYLNKHGEISLDYYNNFTDNIKVYDLAATAEKAAALYEANKDSYENLATEEKQAVYSLLTSYINAIDTYSEQVVNSIYPEGYANLLDLQEKLYCAVNEYVVYFATLTSTSLVNMSTADIEKAIAEIPAKLDGLNAFYASLAAASGEERAAELLGDIVVAASKVSDSLYNTLVSRFTSEVNFAYDLYVALGEPTELTLASYAKLKSAFNNLEDEILTYLTDVGKRDLVSAETIEKYEYLMNRVLNSYNAFKATFGLSNYEQTELTYSVRDVYPNDKVKIDKYEVKEDALLNTAAKLDSFLTGDKFSNLAGINLSETLTGILDNIYSDSLVNTVVQYLYPLIADQFINVWAGIDPVMKQPGSSLNEQLNDSEVTITLNLDEVETATANMGLYLFPNSLATHLKQAYPNGEYDAVADVLASSAINRWNDSAIADENGTLNLKWGVTDKESFVNAVDAALSGLEPLLLALLSNQEMNPGQVVIGNATASGAKATVIITVDVNLTIPTIKLALTASGNEGYNNTLAPIFEALGVATPNGNDFKSTADFVDKGLLAPIEALLNKVAAAPVDTVLSILPNLFYALTTEMIVPLLGMLKTSIAYSADADYSYSAAGLVNGSGTVEGVLKDSIDINVGEMIDLKSMGIDLSNGIQGILDLVGIELPEIDAATVATLGSLKQIDTVRGDYIYDKSVLGVQDGKALTIEADKADVAYYVLTYVVDLLKDEDALRALLSKFVTDEAQVNSIVSTIAPLEIKSTGDVIAALVELFNAEKYEQKTVEYGEFVEVTDPIDTINRDELTEEEKKLYDQYVATHGKGGVVYTQWWTKEKAEYVSDNLIPFVTKLAGILGYDISGLVTDLIANLYTKDNLVKLVDLVNGLLAQVNENESIKSIIDIIDPLVNIDVADTLNTLAAYQVPDFANGDRDAFVNALVDYIKPLVPVLKLLLVDSADNSKLVIADVVDILGYNGYDNAVIPVLEAIGCNPADITKYADFVKLDDEAMVKAVLNPILALIDRISDDPINGIIGLLPNILYFIDFGGLQMAIDALLEPVYVVLDVVRPIYNVDLTINLNLDEIITDLLAKADIKSIGYSDISAIVKSLGKATQYTSANGKTATYVTVEKSVTPEFITVVLRTVLSTVIFSDNVDIIIKDLEKTERYTKQELEDISKILHAIAEIGVPDQILYVLFYVFYGLNTAVTEVDQAFNLVSESMNYLLEVFNNVATPEMKEYFGYAAAILQAIREALEKETEKEPDGFFAKILAFFQRILDWFKRVFKVGK